MGVTNQNRSLGNQLWDLAGGRPSLDLPFADNKSLVDATTGANLVDFTRASSATYVGSDGLIKTAPPDVPRFDHDPATGESLGLLIEDPRTNLLTYSEQFDQWVIGGGSSVTANQAVAPDGTNTADRVQHTGSGSSWIRQDVLNVGTQYTATVYAKAVTPGTNDQFTFNIGGATNSDIKTATSEWQRFTWTATANANSFYINNGDDSFSTDVYFWGAQLEADSFPTSYIPTSDSTVTRAADVASIEGANFSSWYNQSEGTVFYEASAKSPGIPAALFNSGSFNSSSPRINVNVISGSLGGGGRTQVVVSNTQFDTGNMSTPSYSLGTIVKQASAFQIDNFAHCFQGGTVITDNSGTMPSTLSRVSIGFNWTSSYLNGHIARLAYWPDRLPDFTPQTITQ